MTTPRQRSRHSQKQVPPSFGFTSSNASLLLEKAKSGNRRSTPDSEALASSDDEGDHQHNPPAANTSNTSLSKPMRRTSWLNEVQPPPQRKASLATGGSFSPANSQPGTPSADQNVWGSNTSPGLTNNMGWTPGASSFPWGTGIWNNDSRKEPPSRLTEVLPSPTTLQSPTTFNCLTDDAYSPIVTRPAMGDSAIPFAIPLHPTPKTYRSQSYSVGQLDPEPSTSVPPKTTGVTTYAGRGRSSQYQGLQHRPSRPSMLGDLGHDPATLGLVREIEDDEEESDDEPGGVKWNTSQEPTMEQLKLENAMLRQAASRNRTASSSGPGNYQRNGGSECDTQLDTIVESDSDDDSEEVIVFQPRGSNRATGRRFSEQHTSSLDESVTSAMPENRNLESVKKAHWQTSLGFGGLGEPSQSRRHSFADITARLGSMNVSDFNLANMSVRPGATESDGGYGAFPESPLQQTQTQSQYDSSEYSRFYTHRHTWESLLNAENLQARLFAADYFSTERPGSGGLALPSNQPTLHQAYTMPNSYGRAHQPSLNPRVQSLYIVTFKCCRADVFYIQEDTGLHVKPGELVIVEADRGTDLGTVSHANISWAKARELKDHFAEEHYKWLMLFSRQSQNGGPNAVNPNGAPPNFGGSSAVGGMGSQTGHGGQESQSSDIKPKLIKRLAQSHEIQALRDKEGNEAKAKRVCQQKVAEHRLNMEILDAEFQMDWKKLTFYYFADSYINFNSLVTDLFKIYKTRIWMSAINPASFVTPTAGLQPPISAGPGAIGRESPDRRRPHPDTRGYSGPGSQTSPLGYGQMPESGRSAPYDPYSTFGPLVSPGPQHGLGLGQYTQQTPSDMFSPYSPYNTSTLGTGLADITNTQGQSVNDARRNYPSPNDWSVNFRGLSLGS